MQLGKHACTQMYTHRLIHKDETNYDVDACIMCEAPEEEMQLKVFRTQAKLAVELSKAPTWVHREQQDSAALV